MSTDEFPTARRASVMFVYDHRLMLWGGMTQVIMGEGDGRFIVDIDIPDPDSDEAFLEIFDLQEYEWLQQKTTGDFPRMGQGSFFAVIEKNLYIFGGMNDEDYFDGIFMLDLDTFHWQQLPDPISKPSPKSFGGMVAHFDSLVMVGGVGKTPFQPSDKGAQFVADASFRHEFDTGWNNAMHEYHTTTKTWREVDCGSPRPPPCEKLSLTHVDRQRALLFGGKQEKFSDGFNEAFILHLDTLQWEGPFGPSPLDQPWPCPRGLHSAACLVDPNSDIAETQQKVIVVMGEISIQAKMAGDIWILDVSRMTWKELKISLRPRKYHMSCSYHKQERQTDVFLFGGNKQRKSKFDRHVMTGLTIFHFGSVRSLQESCMLLIKNSWTIFEKQAVCLPPRLRAELDNYNTKTDLSHIHHVYPLDSDFV